VWHSEDVGGWGGLALEDLVALGGEFHGADLALGTDGAEGCTVEADLQTSGVAGEQAHGGLALKGPGLARLEGTGKEVLAVSGDANPDFVGSPDVEKNGRGKLGGRSGYDGGRGG